MPSFLHRLLQPAPDSLAARSRQRGKSPWVDAVHLLWTAWLFITPIFDHNAWNLRWVVLTVLSYPVFLVLYARCVMASRRTSRAYAIGMILLCQALLPWYPSGLTYFVFGCVMLRVCGQSFRSYMVALVLACSLLILEGWLIHFPWQITCMIAALTCIIGLIVHAERTGEEKDAELRLSHDEVRRLAATAERERIGRDLHDLLGHTLSLITLKSELANKLFERDAVGARREMLDVERVARDALAQVRRAVTGIRSAGLAAELASAKLLLESDGVHMHYELDDIALPANVETALAMTVREAVTNIQRHARATRAHVKLACSGKQVQLSIADDGRGGAIEPGNGLSGMRERLAGIGADLRVDSQRGRGTTVTVTFALPQQAREPAPSMQWQQAQ
jgi:two-component system sensor histidine kinase DesK